MMSYEDWESSVLRVEAQRLAMNLDEEIMKLTLDEIPDAFLKAFEEEL